MPGGGQSARCRPQPQAPWGRQQEALGQGASRQRRSRATAAAAAGRGGRGCAAGAAVRERTGGRQIGGLDVLQKITGLHRWRDCPSLALHGAVIARRHDAGSGVLQGGGACGQQKNDGPKSGNNAVLRAELPCPAHQTPSRGDSNIAQGAGADRGGTGRHCGGGRGWAGGAGGREARRPLAACLLATATACMLQLLPAVHHATSPAFSCSWADFHEHTCTAPAAQRPRRRSHGLQGATAGGAPGWVEGSVAVRSLVLCSHNQHPQLLPWLAHGVCRPLLKRPTTGGGKSQPQQARRPWRGQHGTHTPLHAHMNPA